MYQVTRWKWNPATARLEIDFTKTTGDYKRTFHIPMMYGDRSDIFFVKGVYRSSQLTVPKDWRIDCNPSHVDGIGCKGNDNGAKGVFFSPGDTIFIRRGTDLTIRYLNKEDMLPFYKDRKEITFPAMKKDKRAVREFSQNQLNQIEAQLKEASGKVNDNCKQVNVQKNTQFSLPAGWFIDTDPPAVEVLRGEGELCFGGIRFREGDTVLFKHNTKMTLRQMYNP